MTLERALIAALILLFLTGFVSCERAKWRECRRYHPRWYCFETGSGRE